MAKEASEDLFKKLKEGESLDIEIEASIFYNERVIKLKRVLTVKKAKGLEKATIAIAKAKLSLQALEVLNRIKQEEKGDRKNGSSPKNI